MQPSNIEWPHQTDGFETTVYDFGNGYGALHVKGSTDSPQTVDDDPETIEMVRVSKDELHPLVLARFEEPRLVPPTLLAAVDLAGKKLQTELANLAELTKP